MFKPGDWVRFKRQLPRWFSVKDRWLILKAVLGRDGSRQYSMRRHDGGHKMTYHTHRDTENLEEA